MRRFGTVGMAIVTLLLAGCGSTPLYTAGLLPIAAVGVVLQRGGVTHGSVEFEDVAVEQVDTPDPNQGRIRVTGQFRYAPARLGGDRFINLEGTGFRVRLLDDAGEELTTFRWPLQLTVEGLTLAAIPADELFLFEIERDISRNLWALVDSCEIVEVYGL